MVALLDITPLQVVPTSAYWGREDREKQNESSHEPNLHAWLARQMQPVVGHAVELAYPTGDIAKPDCVETALGWYRHNEYELELRKRAPFALWQFKLTHWPNCR